MKKNNEQKADYLLDFRDIMTPLALLKFTNAFREMQVDEILEIIGHNRETMADLFKVLPSISYELMIKEKLQDRFFRILIRKKE